MSERIPREILDAAYRRLCRQAAALIAQAMAETDASWEMIETKCGKPSGYFKAFFLNLMDGSDANDADNLRNIAMMLGAMGFVVEFSCNPIPLPAHEDEGE